jgi:hypothetical protein
MGAMSRVDETGWEAPPYEPLRSVRIPEAIPELGVEAGVLRGSALLALPRSYAYGRPGLIGSGNVSTWRGRAPFAPTRVHEPGRACRVAVGHGVC